MPREQPLAQDLMQEDLSSNGSQVEQFLSPTIFPEQQQASKPLAAREHRLHALTLMERYVSMHLASLIFHSQLSGTLKKKCSFSFLFFCGN